MITKQVVTAEQFWEMPEIPGKRFELVDGELVEMPTPGPLHNFDRGVLNHLLYTFVSDRILGSSSVTTQVIFFIASRIRVRIPDISFIAWERVPVDGLPEGYWLIPPDLAVEVVSPTDRADDVYAKRENIWSLVFSSCGCSGRKDRAVSVHTESQDRELGPDDILDGGEVLPGFTVRVGELFAIPTRP